MWLMYKKCVFIQIWYVESQLQLVEVLFKEPSMVSIFLDTPLSQKK